ADRGGRRDRGVAERRGARAARAGGPPYPAAFAPARPRRANDWGPGRACRGTRPTGPAARPWAGCEPAPGGAGALAASWRGPASRGADVGGAGAPTDAMYAAMDWLVGSKDAMETGLARGHWSAGGNRARMALFDLSSSWLKGSRCPLAARGYSRDGKKGKLQIEYGLLTDPAGRPVAVRVFPGNTGDPAAFTQIVDVLRDEFGLAQMA